MIALIIALHHGLIIAYAICAEAFDDFKQIGKGEEIGHMEQWVIRCAIATLITALATHALVAYHDVHWTIGFALLLNCWPLFSLPFRVTLNLLRKLDWRYLGERAAYDQAFLMLGHLIAASISYTGKWKLVGGLIASLFELILFAFCCWWMAQIINP